MIVADLLLKIGKKKRPRSFSVDHLAHSFSFFCFSSSRNGRKVYAAIPTLTPMKMTAAMGLALIL